MKTVSLKIDDSIFGETEKNLGKIKKNHVTVTLTRL